MTHPLAGQSLTDIAKMPGVSDLPMRVKGPFAQALRAEAEGRTEDAEIALNKAIEIAATL